MGMLYGSFPPDEGTILVDGRAVRLRGSHDAIRLGIGMVHQHFMLVECFTVLENIVLGAEGGMLLAPAIALARSKLRELCDRFGLDVDPDARVSDLSVGALQRVEIVKALYRGARILILDEPTAVLTPAEVEQLMAMLERLRDGGATVIIVSHKLKEIMAMTDRVTVMRAGAAVAERVTRETSASELAVLMVGRDPAGVSPSSTKPNPHQGGDRVNRIEVRNLGWSDSRGRKCLDGVSFDLRAGEILGIAGVSGNGQSELLLLLAGMLVPSGGSILLANGAGSLRTIDARHPIGPRELRRLGVAHVPEDRHRTGLVVTAPAWENAALGHLDDARFRLGLFLRPAAMRRHCRSLMESFDVRPADEALPTEKFSGGNQQKLVLAREQERQPDVLLIGQPTRGVDIGAIELIYSRLRQLRARGCAVLLVSTELDEILALSDRIVGMSGGRITGTVDRSEATPAVLGGLMGGTGRVKASSPADRRLPA